MRHSERFPQQSVATQRHSINKLNPSIGQMPRLTAKSSNVNVGVQSAQLSTAVASPNWNKRIFSQLIVKVSPLAKPAKSGFVGVMTGPTLSLTIIICVNNWVLPQASFAVYKRVIFFLLVHVESDTD